MSPRALGERALAGFLLLVVAIVLVGDGTFRAIRRRAPSGEDSLLEWFPAAWRDGHAGEFQTLLAEAREDGRMGFWMKADVAREGALERLRLFAPHPLVSYTLISLANVMIFPQGIVATVLLSVDGVSDGWFLALRVGGPAGYLVAGVMLSGGMLLVQVARQGLIRRRIRCA